MDDIAKEFVSACDLCGGNRFRTVAENMRDTAIRSEGHFAMQECEDCGLVFLNPRPRKEDIARYYPDAYVPYQRGNAFVESIKRFLLRGEKRSIASYLHRGDAVMEIGASTGEFLALFQGGNYRVFGVEMDPRVARDAEERYGIRMFTGTFEDMVFPPRMVFHLIILRFVVEHFASPRAALKKLRTLLPPGSRAYISIPNYEAWERRVFGRFWHGYDVPRHMTIFTKNTMRRYAEDIGFRVESITYSLVPNDWIGSFQRMFREKGWEGLASFFTYRNPLLMVVFFPLGVLGKLLRRSSRFSFILVAE